MFSTPPNAKRTETSKDIGRKTFTKKNISPSASTAVVHIPPCVFSPDCVEDGGVDKNVTTVTVAADCEKTRKSNSTESPLRQQQPPASAGPAEQAESLLARAKAMGAEMKEAMGRSGNLKRDIKTIINKNILEILQIMTTLVSLAKSTPKEGEVRDVGTETTQTSMSNGEKMPTIVDVMEEVRESRRQLAECALFTRTLCEKLDHKEFETPSAPSSSPGSRSYARVAASQQYMPRRPLHSLIISSNDTKDTSSIVVDKIRIAVDARETGIRVDKVRKARDQKVVIGCQTRQELEMVKSRLGGSAAGLKVEEAVNRDPLVVLTDVLSYNTDEDIARAILKQNQHLLGELKKDEVRVTVKYRRRARNPHESHVVIQVSPPVWQALTRAGRAHIDLQRVRVFDQTPLVQCTRCLGFGHGRKQCTGKDDVCSHCGDAHLRAECPSRQAGEPPKCCNCKKAGQDNLSHNGFSVDCPLRRRWDAIARSTVAYC